MPLPFRLSGRPPTALFAALFAAVLAICAESVAAAADWTVHDPDSTAVIDHQAWDALLARHVAPGPAGVNRFAYAMVSDDERTRLDQYLARMAAVEISRYCRDAQLAYWINLYNALTVQVVLDHYPVDSIRDITIDQGLFDMLDVFSEGPWGAELITIAGEAISLDDIEHRILRPIWQDPRIHYGVNCASLGCPDLARQAYNGANVHGLLDARARAFINHPRGVGVTEEGLILSRIYDWFEADFGAGQAGVLAHLAGYADEALAGVLAEAPAIIGYRYDWRLNSPDTPPPEGWRHTASARH